MGGGLGGKEAAAWRQISRQKELGAPGGSRAPGPWTEDGCCRHWHVGPEDDKHESRFWFFFGGNVPAAAGGLANDAYKNGLQFHGPWAMSVFTSRSNCVHGSKTVWSEFGCELGDTRRAAARIF